MPLRKPEHQQYSTNPESDEDRHEDFSDDDLTVDDLDGGTDDAGVIEALTAPDEDEAAVQSSDQEPVYLGRSYVSRGGNDNGIDEMLAQLDGGEGSKFVSEADEKPSKNVSAPASKTVSEPGGRPSKIVSENKRRSLANDKKTVAKMRSFCLSDVSAAPTSSVSYPASSSLPSTTTAPKPANDNNRIPVWSLTGELVTAVCACAALQIDDNPAIAFTFNLTPDAIERAKRDPDGFLDPLKRSFDQSLKRAGVVLPYFFAVDIDEDERPHLHGAFRYPAREVSITMVRRIREIMKDSWGAWTGPGKHKQLLFKTLYSDDWATYCLKNGKAVQKIIGPRTFTITHALGREAKWFYNEFRRILKGTD